MIESAAVALDRGRLESGREHAAKHQMQRHAVQVRSRTGRDNTGISGGGNLSSRPPIQTGVSSTPGLLMLASLIVPLLLASQGQPLDSATVTRVLNQLRASDSIVCALAGQALTNYGGWWGWNRSEPGLPMPRPMPTPMPMPGGGSGGRGIRLLQPGPGNGSPPPRAVPPGGPRPQPPVGH